MRVKWAAPFQDAHVHCLSPSLAASLFSSSRQKSEYLKNKHTRHSNRLGTARISLVHPAYRTERSMQSCNGISETNIGADGWSVEHSRLWVWMAIDVAEAGLCLAYRRISRARSPGTCLLVPTHSREDEGRVEWA